MPPVALLGSQRFRPVVAEVLDDLGIGPEATVAVVNAGWQEREGEDEEIAAHLGRPLVNLRLHHRTEELFESDPELLAVLRRRQDRLRELQRLYRLRLDPTLDAARRLLRRSGDPELLEPEREAALEAVRTLDRHHLDRVEALRREADEEIAAGERESLASARREIAAEVAGASVLAVAGGHVAVLANRLRLFGVLAPGGGGLAGHLPVVAWAAGAMALTSRIALFHDSPPQGFGNPEVLGRGLGVVGGLVALPHAERRLRLGDRSRVEIFARRFLPDRCLAFDDGSRLVLDDHRPARARRVRLLAPDGRVLPYRPQEAAA